MIFAVEVGKNWRCPYCGHAQVLDLKRVEQNWYRQRVEGWKGGTPTVFLGAIVCANDDCRELSLWAVLGTVVDRGAREDEIKSPFKSWTLLPPSSAKPQPDCIPQPIRNDYYEACAIRDLSPKASATTTRRCLQGMIRDFCGISKKRLIEEIDELDARVHDGTAPAGVQPDTVEAIDASTRSTSCAKSGTSARTWRPTSTSSWMLTLTRPKYSSSLSSFYLPSGMSLGRRGPSVWLSSN